jgi:predicted O-linked N-acetylglucosamine transferase (SPINDLY family)
MSVRTEELLKRAVAAHLGGQPGDAFALYQAFLGENPCDFRALHLAGAVAFQLERMDESASLLRRAVRVRPDSGSTVMCLGLACAALGLDGEAEQNLKAGLALEPRNPEAWVNLGGFLVTTGRNPEALSCYRRALQLRPGYAAALTGIAEVYKCDGHAAEAVGAYALALKADPGGTTAGLGLVQALQSCNRIPESLAQCDRLLAAHPRHVRARSSRLFLLNYLSGATQEQLFGEHRAFGGLFPAASPRVFPKDRDPGRRLRVAFLSPDLRAHSVAFFLEPLVANLDRGAFEIVLYHDHVRADGVSERLRSHAALWRNFAGRSDSFVEAAVRGDAPDVIVDLAGHTGQNRVHLFARRLAPVQVTYLGYPNTTGIAEMDYRFTDAIADPRGAADRLHVERLVRFAPCAWAYRPSDEVVRAGAPVPVDLKAATAFGSFNNLCKVNGFTLRLWAGVLGAVAGSRLVLKSFGLDPERMKGVLAGAGIDPLRVLMLPPDPNVTAHMQSYRHMDIALDPYPYGGTTTTCEALWMGRPVVTLAGDRHSSRVGASLLGAVGRGDWVARTEAEYVAIAAKLAADRSRLAMESAGLRDAMLGSALLDHRAQARRFGGALRECWASWCAGERGRAAPAETAGLASALT